MGNDGSNVHQVLVQPEQRLRSDRACERQGLFSRWDHAGSVNGINLYQMNPDGTQLELVYGAHSHLTGTNNTAVQFLDPREMPDGRVMAIVRQFDHPELVVPSRSSTRRPTSRTPRPVASSAGMAGRHRHGYAESGDYRSFALEGRAVQLGVSVVGWHGPRARELGNLPARGAGSRATRPRRSFVPCH